jgi:peptidoglycan/xylan/chitin deacetylase (PgdA/CDA1 family)
MRSTAPRSSWHLSGTRRSRNAPPVGHLARVHAVVEPGQTSGGIGYVAVSKGQQHMRSALVGTVALTLFVVVFGGAVSTTMAAEIPFYREPSFPVWAARRGAPDMYISGVRAYRKKATITIDDVRTRNATATIAALQRAGIRKATIFVVVSDTTTECVVAIKAAGYEVASHGMWHFRPMNLTPDEASRQISESAMILCQMTGDWPLWYRAPWEDYGGSYRAAALNGQLVAGVSNGSRDHTMIPAWKVARNVIRQRRRGCIILMHAQDNTFNALPTINKDYRRNGYQFVTLTELVRNYGNPTSNPKRLRR